MGEYLQEAVLPVQYDNYVFDLYGTLVEIGRASCRERV